MNTTDVWPGPQIQTAPRSSALSVPEWLAPRHFSILLLVLILASFPDLIFSAKTFYFRDYALFGYPLAHYHREAFWRGEIPLWNPLNNCGIPYVAQWNTMVFYPLSLIYLLLPLPWSLGWFCLLHLFLAGFGMYRLAFHGTTDRLAASVAGIAFAFSGLTLASLIWPNNIAALGWLPWVLLAVRKALGKGGSELIKASVIGAIQMLSGAPEIILFTWMLIAAMSFWEFCNCRDARGRVLRNFALIVLLVTGLSAIQLLPFLDLLRHSQRVGQNANTSWSMPPCGWANFLVPLFQTSKTSAGVFLQPSQGWTSSYYLGIAPLVLALVAVWKIRRPVVWFGGVVLAGSAILGLGENGYLLPWLQRLVPQLAFMRYPVKILVFAAVLVPILTAYAVAHWRKEEGTDQQREFFQATALTTFACLLLIGGLVLFSWNFPGHEEDPRTTLWNGMSRGAVLILVLALLYLNYRYRAAGIFRNAFCQAALLAAVWLDLISHVPNQNPTAVANAYKIDLPTLAAMQPRPQMGGSRALLTRRSIDKFHTTIVSNGFDTVLGVRMALYDNCNLLEGIPKIDGFYSLYLPEEQHVRFFIYPSTNSVHAPLADFLGASQVSSDRSFLDWEARPNWMPMITTGQRPAFASDAETLEGLSAQAFDPRKIVFLPPEARHRISATNGAAATIVTQSVSPQRIRIDAIAEKPSLLVIAQSFYHWWRPTVDGRPVTLWRANHAFQAVEIPAGRHHIDIIYQDRAFHAGRLISGASIATCAASFVWCRRRRSSDTDSVVARRCEGS